MENSGLFLRFTCIVFARNFCFKYCNGLNTNPTFQKTKKVSQNNRVQIDQIRRELLQLSETHRIPKGDEEENKIKLRRIEERLPEFEKQIMLFTNVKEELRKITANYSYLQRKFDKYDENLKNHDNLFDCLKGNEKYYTEKFKTNIRNSEHLGGVCRNENWQKWYV